MAKDASERNNTPTQAAQPRELNANGGKRYRRVLDIASQKVDFVHLLKCMAIAIARKALTPAANPHATAITI
ncbi:hypothetical protein ACSEE7_20560, partial [Halomonas cupida]|uniref:hypothetical protein n=1 Tax=Halomonas cupida TaxID=44933 RepID=UPI003EFB0B6F